MEVNTHREVNKCYKDAFLNFLSLHIKHLNQKQSKGHKPPSPWHITLWLGPVRGCTGLSCWRLIVAYDLSILMVSLIKAENLCSAFSCLKEPSAFLTFLRIVKRRLFPFNYMSVVSRRFHRVYEGDKEIENFILICLASLVSIMFKVVLLLPQTCVLLSRL